MTQVTLLNQIKPLLQNLQDKSRPSFQLLNGTVASVLKVLDPISESEAIYRIENQTTGNWAEVIPALKNMVEAAKILRDTVRKQRINDSDADSTTFAMKVL